jgi:anaerobic selenocysteine-containing dehydrogenase
MRCLALPEVVNHPDRLKYPMKRAGARGENKWERITWDEALDMVCSKASEFMEKYGGKSIVCQAGTGRNATWQMPVLGWAAFKSPNDCGGFLSGDACYTPRMAAMNAMFGATFIADCSQFFEDRYDNPNWRAPEIILVWGNNPIISNPDGFMGHWLVDCMKRGSKLIVVDPRLTWLAAKAVHWLQLRPGTDAALALGFLNVIINEELYDKEFI